MVYNVTCAECSAPVETKRKNTKYCGVCRLYRNLIYLQGKTTTCWACDERFLLADRADRVCPDCLPSTAHTGACAVCNRDDQQMVTSDVAVCRRCIHAPEHRKTIIKALRQRQIKQQKENAHEHAV